MEEHERSLPLDEDETTTTQDYSSNTHDLNVPEVESLQHYAPPAHIAARFYRNKMNARRKSSATSSRRNSLSSAHSHASSRSHHRSSGLGCQSNCVAQQLRRASILESRRARLADRAAHAEQVRLRAAIYKATPRGNVSVSEEKALAAQLAKEKYLAKVAAQCAEEVARAKRVAEEVKERKLAEEARVRLEMEEKHAEVEKRRVEYQRNLQARRRRRSDCAEKTTPVLEVIADVDEEIVQDGLEEQTQATRPQLCEADAAMRIQRAWRTCKKRRIVGSFTDIRLYERAQDESFDAMVALIAEQTTVHATTALLTHLKLQTIDDQHASLNTKTFLSAYMICGHPVTVLNNQKGAQEQDLISKASELIESFKSTIAQLADWNGFMPNDTRLETLSQSYSAYTSAFAAWRLQDSSVIIEGMVASFVELDAIWQTVKDDSRGEVASDYREGIRDNQVMLLSRIRKLAGAERADTLIKKAIRESRKRRPKKPAATEIRPRGVESAQPEASTSATASSAGDINIPEITEPLRPAENVDASTLGQIFARMPSNRILTHELAIDKEWRLSQSASSSRNELYRTMCDSLKQSFEAGDSEAWTVAVAENIREKLLRMLKPGNPMHTLILESMDLESIRRQCQQQMFSYDGFFQFMATILPKLCAPIRDNEVKAVAVELTNGVAGLEAMTEKLFTLLRMVETLTLDYTNFMIAQAAPMLIREASGYEHRSFAKDLESGAITLDKTKRWWRQSFENLTAEADRRDPENVRNPADRPTSHKVYAHALVYSITQKNQISALPETLALDQERLQTLSNQCVWLTVIAAMLLTAKNLLKRDSRSQWKAEAQRLWQSIFETSEDDRALSTEEQAQKCFGILETAHNMPPATKQQLLHTIQRLISNAYRSMHRGQEAEQTALDPVLKVLFQRLRSHILARLTASTSSERVRAASSASETLASFGMPEFAAQVASIVDTLDRVRQLDWAAHGLWHERIFAELDNEVQAAGG